MKNVDQEKNEFVHLFIALRRRKDNPEVTQLCLRQIIFNSDDEALEELENRLKHFSGTWRIHKTINKRSTIKAMNILQHRIIDDPVRVSRNMVSEWKTCLMLPKAKAERNILLDIDSDEALHKVNQIILENGIQKMYQTQSVSGHHIVIDAKNTDTRLFKDIEDLTFQRDGYVFIKLVKENR